jgi:hypothetical protein
MLNPPEARKKRETSSDQDVLARRKGHVRPAFSNSFQVSADLIASALALVHRLLAALHLAHTIAHLALAIAHPAFVVVCLALAVTVYFLGPDGVLRSAHTGDRYVPL